MFQPATSSRTNQRTNPAPRVLTKLPQTPAAAVRTRIPLPKGTLPKQPSGAAAIFGLAPGVVGGQGSNTRVQVPTYALGRRDLARAFYTRYVLPVHKKMSDPAKQHSKAAASHRTELAAALKKGKREEPEAFAAFRDQFDGAWGKLMGEPSGVDWLLAKRDLPFAVTEVGVQVVASGILQQLYGGTASGTADADLRANMARLVDPMSAQDFYNQYLRPAHASYQDAWSFTNMDETNDFAEALATGRRASAVGYEALRLQVKEAAGNADVLEQFRTAWNHYLRLTNGHGSEAEITVKGGERVVDGKTRDQWKAVAEDAMSKVSAALERAL